MYERNEKLYRHKIFQMKKVIPSFQYEPLVLILEPKTLYEEKEKRQINGARPSETRIVEDELVDLRGGRNSPPK